MRRLVDLRVIQQRMASKDARFARQARAARAKAKTAQRGDRCPCGCILLCPGETQCASCRGVG